MKWQSAYYVIKGGLCLKINQTKKLQHQTAATTTTKIQTNEKKPPKPCVK